ncbi:uncharacterized protein [Venturia canescens]|uniref:uncharacterized protein n=1 Tax=Venturia canescens TaxID=32260 RepID=UPI001C9C5908|nr:uncharacterized protein LOC122414517 [Venturia canescens]XP_043281787.1 uncharacterized protein LOC122414517 [Venturia canescens]XP_043281788.1 uncharacterized protein LOC122414517 [Venturia canescens]XP_043281792.1 uncharacterized protein LOC122414517 [Venturia canescens]
MDNIIDSLRDHFYANACHVCWAYGKDIKLKRCGNCLMIAYCSREHQIVHWPKHKDMCKAISELKKVGLSYQMRDSLFGSLQESWRAIRKTMLRLIQSKLGRPLSGFEIEMVTLPRCCVICHETEHSRLRDCTECPSASFCYDHPKDVKHDIQCKMSKLHLEQHNVMPDMVPHFKNTFSLFYGENAPLSMDEVIDVVKTHCCLRKNSPPKLVAAVISTLLTSSYTFMYSMEKLSRSKLQKLKVHIIDTDTSIMDSLLYWEYVLHRNESLEELQIVLVGSSVDCRYCNCRDFNTSAKIQLCEKCTKHDRKMTIQVIGVSYEQLTASANFVKPDYVIRFNLGTNESESDHFDPWPATSIRALAKIGCPFFMTSCTAEELKKNEKKINSILGKEIKPFWTGKNPFSSSQLVRNYESDDFCYDNQYLTIYEVLS